MKRLHKFLSLTQGDRFLLLSALLLLSVVRLGLWLLPFQMLRRFLERISQVNLERQDVGEQPRCTLTTDKIVWAVDVASCYMPGGVKCLARALTTQVLMSRYGYSPELRIGVAKGEGGRLEAHAWVEIQGQVVIGYLGDLSRFTPMASFEGGRL
jgi:hypothetical protein